MSTFIRVFCRNPAPVTRAELARFVHDGVYFDRQPTFEPADALQRRAGDEWNSFEIIYDPDKRPIVLWRTVAGDLLSNEVAEAIDALSSPGTLALPGLVDRLLGTSVIYTFEVNEGTLTDDAWVMLDTLESHLARSYEGIVYAADDGFFDADLTRVATLQGLSIGRQRRTGA